MPTTICISHVGWSLNRNLAFSHSLKNVGHQQAQCFTRNGYNPLMGSQFSLRERQIIELLLQGKTNKEIALLLQISRRTVEFHASNIYAKLGVHSRTEFILRLCLGIVFLIFLHFPLKLHLFSFIFAKPISIELA
jgi:DNA-binding NarL/FixJ family response regulator